MKQKYIVIIKFIFSALLLLALTGFLIAEAVKSFRAFYLIMICVALLIIILNTVVIVWIIKKDKSNL
ncbi:MAG TPA: hypothetical protein VIL23_01675 [Clostridia bacterium]